MVDSSTPWQILSQSQFNLPGIMSAASQAKRSRLEEMMLNRQIEREDKLEQTRAKATDLYRSGNRKAAREEAMIGGDFDFANVLGKMDEADLAQVKQRSELIGNIAQWADNPQKWDQGIDYLVSQGYSDLAQYRGKFTPEARMAAISGAGQIKDYMERSKPVNMAPGNRLVDPATGKVIAEAPFAPHYGTVSEGQSAFVYDPGKPTDPASIFNRMIGAESGGNHFGPNGAPLTSPAGAIGIAQVMPGTAPEAAALAGLPFDENRYRTDPEYNRALGEAYFNKQLQTFGDPAKAVAAYNAGPGAVQAAVQKGGANWLEFLPQETQGYVGRVLGGGSQVIAQGPPKQDKPPAPPAGYRWKPDGSLEPIPGGPQDKPENRPEAYSQSAMDAFNRAIDSANRLLKHPGFETAVGVKGLTGGLLGGWVVPGTDAADFKAELDAMKAQVFLPMVQSMKGMGALSNAEGEKLTASIGALDPSMSEAGFKASLNRIIADLNTYKNRATGGKQQSARSAPASGGWGRAKVIP